MIRDDRFVLSWRQFAVDLCSLETRAAGVRVDDAKPIWHATVKAVWFRRRKGVTVACTGTLWDFQQHKPVDVTGFLAVHDDGRHGGSCEARWDGKGYWGTDDRPEVRDAHLGLLKPMLERYPEVPRGFHGWWRF